VKFVGRDADGRYIHSSEVIKVAVGEHPESDSTKTRKVYGAVLYDRLGIILTRVRVIAQYHWETSDNKYKLADHDDKIGVTDQPMTWNQKGPSGLQAQLARELVGGVTAFAFGQEARLVRGVMNDPARRGVARVVLWDGRRLETSVAFDVPLTDSHGGNIPPGHLVADLSDADTDKAPRDAFGIPVLDATTAVRAFDDRPRFHLSDALRAAAAAFSAPPEPELRLRGFLLLDQEACRLYLDTPTTRAAPPLGIDLPLREDDGSVSPGVTGAHAALPVLLETGELDRMRKDTPDPYCHTVYDLVPWLTGR